MELLLVYTENKFRFTDGSSVKKKEKETKISNELINKFHLSERELIYIKEK